MKTRTLPQLSHGIQDLDSATMVNTSGGWFWMVLGWSITGAVIYGAFMAGYDAACGCR